MPLQTLLFFLALALTAFAPDTARAGQPLGLRPSGQPHHAAALTPDTAGPGSLAILHSFGDGSVTNDGENPYAALLQGSDGNFYGTTYQGGSTVAADPNGVGYGTVFRMTPGGAVTILHSFGDGTVTNDGENPDAALVQGTDGNFYGITVYGGSTVAADPNGQGYGTVFQITPSGTLTILHSFGDGTVTNDGEYPEAGLVQGSDGNFYGTTGNGGSTADSQYSGAGTVFQITPEGTVTILHSFGDGTVTRDGAFPYAALVQGTDGNFYGTTYDGGSVGYGTVFRITPSGTLTILHNFGDGSVTKDGRYPEAGLVQGSDGNFYGTTDEGGSASDGTVFRITPSGTLTILHSFGDGSVTNDGAFPEAGLVQGSDGNFYGTTGNGGSTADSQYSGAGTVFQITPGGTVTILHSFGDGTVTNDGEYPDDALVQGTDGNLYGITYQGGSAGDGTVFQFLLTPTITSISPTAGPVGSVITITGTNFSNVTRVRFHNANATTYTVNSSTQITVTVPSGAGTGTITVNEPGETAVSSQTFTVLIPPTITSISPTSGPVGTTVTITGTNFADVSRVRFHNASATTYTVNSSTQITVTVPSGAGTGTITVNEIGTSATSSQTFTVTVPPTITSISPTSGPVGTTVTINGTNFTGATSVTFHGTAAASFTVNSSTQITCTVPSGAGTGTITVNETGTSVTSGQTFTVTSSLPIITSIAPTSGPIGTTVTITGTNLKTTTKVRFHNAYAVTFSSNTEGTQLTVTVPTGAGTGTITVTTPAGAVTSSQTFTVIPAPTITSFTPTSAHVGTVVTITGTNLSGVTKVRFHNASAVTYSVNGAGTQITVTVPSGAATGTITVTTPGGSVTSSGTITIS